MVAKKWYYENREKELAKERIRRANPKNKLKHKIYQRIWAKNNREIVGKYYKNWMSKNKNRIDLRLNKIIRNSIRDCKKGRKKHVGKLSIDFVTLQKHLESQFDVNMDWGNFGVVWDIDHIIPISWFKTQDQLLKKGWALNNLQPLEKNLNRKKSNFFVAKRELLVTKEVIYL
jgi:hypothetical protein